MSTPPPEGSDGPDPFVTIEKDHWEKNWEGGVGERPLSLLNVFNRDATALLSKSLHGTARPCIVEIGFAPGKYLQYFERRFQAVCHGYDYSESGCRQARRFLGQCGAAVQVHCQDVLAAPPDPTHGAQLVYSIGVVEHFSDPTGMIHAHLAPLASDGVAVIILPNYHGLNQRIQARLDPQNLAIHNLESMTAAFWQRHASRFPAYEFSTYRHGRLNPWMFSLQRYGKAGRLLQLGLNFLSFVLPPRVQAWASMFVIEIRRR